DGDGDETDTGESTTGDGDGEPILLDMGMMIDICPAIDGQDDCQLCAAQSCCFPGAETCFQNGTDCKCILDCMNQQMGGLMTCGTICEADPNNVELVEQFAPCMEFSCDNLCG
ncbi:MAG TPA: hypothetical protein VM869_35400, partial [Enhygromyxa sp.]|nr:hypothetical protein [Enhygromyxa sp.]